MKKKHSTPVEYKILSGKPYLILKRKKGDELTVHCPFCGTRHIHGSGDGHRIAHCASDPSSVKEFVTADDGTILYQKDGYVLVTVPRIAKAEMDLGTYSTIIKALSPDGKLRTYEGPNVPGISFADAQDYCYRNGLGYCKVEGRLLSSVTIKDGKADWDNMVDYEKNRLN